MMRVIDRHRDGGKNKRGPDNNVVFPEHA